MNKKDYFHQPLDIGDKVLVTSEFTRNFRVAEVLRFTGKSIVLTRTGVPQGKKPVYASPDSVIKMNEHLAALTLLRHFTSKHYDHASY